MSVVDSLNELYRQLADLKAERGTLWFGISGTWRTTSHEVERDVRTAVRQILGAGDGIVSGGALGVDYFATDEALRLNPAAERIRIYIPVNLEIYAAHLRLRAGEGVITPEAAERLVGQLAALKAANPAALVEHPTNTVCNEESYFSRDTDVANASDALVAFQVNGSLGTADTVAKAEAQGKAVCLKRYVV